MLWAVGDRIAHAHVGLERKAYQGPYGECLYMLPMLKLERVTNSATGHLATLRESWLLPPFTCAWMNFFTLVTGYLAHVKT